MKTTKTKQALTLKAAPIAPPLKREEIIEGLLILAKEKHDKEVAAIKEQLAKLRAEWDKECASVLAKGAPNFRDPHGWDNHEIRVTVKTTDAMRRIGRAFDKLNVPHWDEDRQRKLIAEEVKRKANRAPLLLANPETRKAFEAMAAQVGLLAA